MRLLSNVSDEEEARLIPRTPVLVAFRGSHSHGTYVPTEDETGVDDIDLITAYIPSIDHYFGTEGQKWVGKDVKIREWDGVAYEYRHFVHLLEHCNPNVISALWLRPDHYFFIAPEGRVLIENRDLFSSKIAGKSFGGYAYSQLRRMTAFKDSGASECGCTGTFHGEQCPLRAERGRGSAKLYATGLLDQRPKETHEDRDYRRKALREFGARPYPMPFVRNDETVGFQRWVIGAYDKRVTWAEWERAGHEPRKLADKDQGSLFGVE